MKNRILPVVVLAIVLIAVLVGVVYFQKEHASHDTQTTSTTAVENPSDGGATPTAKTPDQGVPMSNPNADLTIDESTGLSKAVVTITTPKGQIKFRFYSKDAPETSKRISQLIQQKFYDGLIFHRVVPGFVAQGGDPTGTGTSGSGQKLKAEFNSRKHVEGAIAMARAADPNSADSQFYITLGTFPHLDNNYTIFGQVVEGLDVAKKLEQGDAMTSVVVQ